jgi:hypothetical protein
VCKEKLIRSHSKKEKLPTSSYAIINPLEMPSLKVHTCGEGA